MDDNLFRKRLIRLRKMKGLTQVDMAKILGIGRSTYTHYEIEDRHRTPDLKTLSKLADIHSVTVDYLIGRTDDPNGGLRTLELTRAEDLTFTVDGKPISREHVDLLISLVRGQRLTKNNPPNDGLD